MATVIAGNQALTALASPGGLDVECKGTTLELSGGTPGGLNFGYSLAQLSRSPQDDLYTAGLHMIFTVGASKSLLPKAVDPRVSVSKGGGRRTAGRSYLHQPGTLAGGYLKGGAGVRGGLPSLPFVVAAGFNALGVEFLIQGYGLGYDLADTALGIGIGAEFALSAGMSVDITPRHCVRLPAATPPQGLSGLWFAAKGRN